LKEKAKRRRRVPDRENALMLIFASIDWERLKRTISE
jgi:hypothetical protein